MEPSKQVLPPQIKYIIGNELCERFSYYGIKGILVIFLAKHFLMPAHEARALFHTFVAAGYLFPLVGAYLSDRLLGKYRTIMILSIIYCLGNGVMALGSDSTMGLYWGLGLIALGMGGIKPCVSSFVGDQFTAENKWQVKKVYDIFYWTINCGSLLSSLTIPLVLAKYGPAWAFGIPGILMGIATLIFWLGHRDYVNVPPSRETGEAGFLAVLTYALTHQGQKKNGQKFFDVALTKYAVGEVEAAQAVADIFKVFVTVTAFWALWDQQSSSWVLQADQMNLTVCGVQFLSSQIHGLNPILIMSLIPVFACYIYPAVENLGIKATPLRKMGFGMALAGFSFVAVGIIQLFLDSGHKLSVAWQIIPYVIITMAEIMISITGLEFAYSQAPRSMKSTIMSFWFLTVFAGNSLTAYVSKINVFPGAGYFFFFAALMGVIAAVFALVASRYKVREYFEHA